MFWEDFRIILPQNKIFVTADILQYVHSLQELKNEFPEQVEVINNNFFTLPKLAFQDSHDGGSRVQTLLHRVSKAEWEDGKYCVYSNTVQECLYRVIKKSHNPLEN